MYHPDYPRASDVDRWCDELLARADAVVPHAELLDTPDLHPLPRNTPAGRFVRFAPETPDAAPFFGLWQPVHNGGPAPLLVHLPGYGAEMTVHPALVATGFNVLHVGPQGYFNVAGADASRRRNEIWPVLPDTVTTLGKHGYGDWLTDVLIAVRWALTQPEVQPQRLAFFGTSQGGGGALLMGSLMRDRGVKAVCADEPFLTGFFMMHGRKDLGAYFVALNPLDQLAKETPDRQAEAWRAIGFIDTLSHAHRLTMPTLLTAGSVDTVCPTDTIRALFDRLPSTRSFTEMAGMGHGYTVPFGELVRAWCTLYV